MILYQLAKDMEKRAMLDRSIRETTGDVRLLIEEKAGIEQSVLLQAAKWKEADQTALAMSGAE
jgi:hypothetical protein